MTAAPRLGILGMALFLSVGTRRTIQFSGLALALGILAIYRRAAPHGHAAWLNFDYLEILGIIGCTYFAVAILYIATRRKAWAPDAWFFALVILSAFCAAHRVNIARNLPLYVWPIGDGTLAFISMAGVITSAGFTSIRPVREKLVGGVYLAAAMLIAGRLFTPLGISKIRETPTWGLYSAAAAVLVFTALYWLCDVKRRTAWAAPVHAAGANTLLTYLLPDILYFTLGLLDISLYAHHFNAGLPGILRSLVFTAVILAVSTLLLRRGVRLQL
jgi:heparan-alpha-glucosaminide N-acetyltransferase